MEDPFIPNLSRLAPPEEAEAAFRSQLPSWQMHFAADDYVEYTWHAPTVRLYVARPTLRMPPGAGRCPEWIRHAMGGTPACIDPMWHKAAEVISTTLIDLLSDPAILAEAVAEFRQRTDGGIGGNEWVAPLLPADFQAPIHYRWPEWIETPRGKEWSVL